MSAKLLSYSACYWADHAKAIKEDSTVIQLARSLFLDPKFEGNYKTFLQIRTQAELLEFPPTLLSHIISEYDPDLSPLYYPVLCGLTGVARRFIEMYPTWLNKAIGDYGTPLLIAAGQNDVGMVNLLADLRANIDLSCHTWLSNEMRPLHYATYLGNSEAVDALLDRGANVNLSEHGKPLLHMAALLGKADLVKRLIDSGADIEIRDRYGLTVLFSGLMAESLEVVQTLCENGCDIKAVTGSGKTSIQYALELGEGTIISYLFEKAGDAIAATLLGNLRLEQIDWAKSEQWYPKAVQLFGTKNKPLSHGNIDVYRVYLTLKNSLGLPIGPVLEILDLAKFWVRTNFQRKEYVQITQHSPDDPYLSVAVRGPLRRIKFRTVTLDQGMNHYSTCVLSRILLINVL